MTTFMRAPRAVDEALERVEESRIVVLVDMVLVPETGIPDPGLAAIAARPRQFAEGGSSGVFSEIAQERDAVPLDISAYALGPVDRQRRSHRNGIARMMRLTSRSVGSSLGAHRGRAVLDAPGGAGTAPEFTSVDPTSSLKIDPR